MRGAHRSTILLLLPQAFFLSCDTCNAQKLYEDVDTWIETCSDALLTDPSGDGIVNQNELADFFTSECQQSTVCEETSYSFNSLPLGIQILFHLGTCWNNRPEAIGNYTDVTTNLDICEDCYEQYLENRVIDSRAHDAGAAKGKLPQKTTKQPKKSSSFWPKQNNNNNVRRVLQTVPAPALPASSTNLTSELCLENNTTAETAAVGIVLQKNVTVVLKHLCRTIWDPVVQEGIITLGGALAPSDVPSHTPTSEPTAAPSDVPTGQPSFAPTLSARPSFVPTVSHGPSLSFHPTYITPSGSPTGYPTMVASNKPSKSRKKKPSSPAPSLSISPSVHPTAEPSVTPSMVPTASPSGTPSRLPSVQPSDGPSKMPSDEPSMAPSSMPSAAPT